MTPQVAYYWRNREKVLAYRKKFYRKNRLRLLKKRQQLSWEAKLISNARSSVRIRGGPKVTITPAWVREQFKAQDGRCYWSGLPMRPKDRGRLYQPSIDKLVPSKGYTPDNVVLTTLAMNLARTTAKPAEFRKFLADLKTVL